MRPIITCLLPGSTWDRAIEGLLGEGERLARQLGAQHVSLVVSSADASLPERVAAHADSVVVLQISTGTDYHPERTLALIESTCKGLTPQAVLLSSDTYSQELTPRLARRLNGCSIGDAQKLILENGRLRAHKSVYGGKAMAVVQANRDPAVIWLRARAYAPEPARSQPGAITEKSIDSTLSPAAAAVQLVERQQAASTAARLEDARVIVSGGRGLGGPGPFEDLHQLAQKIGGQVGASRAACDLGWVPPNYQIGQTGKKVAPELYLAVAISGASQHLMGIADARFVAAINTDRDAPIYRRADLGLTEDYKKVLGPLKERLAALLK